MKKKKLKLEIERLKQENIKLQTERDCYYEKLKSMFGAHAAHESQQRDAFKSELGRVLTPSYKDYTKLKSNDYTEENFRTIVYVMEEVFTIMLHRGIKFGWYKHPEEGKS